MAAKRKTASKQKLFLAIFLGSEKGEMMKKWAKLTPKERKQREAEGINAWHDWAEQHKKSIVDLGSPLGATMRADRKGITKTSNAMTGYTLVRAKNHKAATKLFAKHPHFTVFPGEAIEVMECGEIPDRP